jgi:glucosylceramidase
MVIMVSEKLTKNYLIICLVILLLPIILSVNPPSCVAQEVHWQCSTNTNRWIDRGTLQISPWDNDTTLYIEIDSNTTYQEIDGFGGCFNELGWDALSALGKTERDNVMKALFDPNTGCKFNICRMPIGASDFAMNYYSLNDMTGDYAMNSFSIARDRERLIPYVKAAMVYKPDMKMWGSPWTPPAWMKTNGAYNGGRMIQTTQNLTAYALYLAKAVQAYQAEGLDFYALHVQNEPQWESNFPSCAWNGNELRDFIKNYLGPKFLNDKINAEIWLGTMNDGDFSALAGIVLSDNTANSYITGVGFQWFGKFAIQTCHDQYPDKRLMQTETECGYHQNDWDYAKYTFDLMKMYFDGWANSYMQWNMVLDQTGLSSWGWAQCSMISVDKNTKAVTYNPQFYCAKHFSYYVKPGAYRIYSGGNYSDKIAFMNPDGDMVLVVKNNITTDLAVAIKFGNYKIEPIVPANSFNTFIISSNISPPAQSPYGGNHRTIPGTIQAEDYDVGGEGVAYHDADSGNNGGQYRSEGVDIETCGEGGYDVGWTDIGEWLEYTVDVTAGTYNIIARVAGNNPSGASITFKLDETTVGTISVPNTGGWQNWTDVSISNVSISGGNGKILRLELNGLYYNLNSIRFEGSSLVTRTPTTAQTPSTCLIGNYPNPFNGETHIIFQLKNQSNVQIRIFNTFGQLVRVLINDTRPAGDYSLVWDDTDDTGNQVPSGIYFCHMKAGDFAKDRKMILLK